MAYWTHLLICGKMKWEWSTVAEALRDGFACLFACSWSICLTVIVTFGSIGSSSPQTVHMCLAFFLRHAFQSDVLFVCFGCHPDVLAFVSLAVKSVCWRTDSMTNWLWEKQIKRLLFSRRAWSTARCIKSAKWVINDDSRYRLYPMIIYHKSE